MFQGRLCAYQLICGDGSSVLGCTFADNRYSSLGATGDAVVEACVFGPSTHQEWNAVDLAGFHGSFVNNLFANLNLDGRGLSVEAQCMLPGEVSGNVFDNCDRQPGQGGPGTPLAVNECWEHEDGTSFRIEDNIFVNCNSNALCTVLSVEGQAQVIRNRFFFNSGVNVPTVNVDGAATDSSLIRENLFFGNDWAMYAYDDTVDARWNWWGDSTGPYNAQHNPDGQGDEVGNNVVFDPWYPDTSFLAAPPARPVGPREFAISVYPNPFNGNFRLRIEIPRAAMLTVALYDVLGRKFADVWRGAVGFEREIGFDASALPSGVYFARATSDYPAGLCAMTKVVLLK
jgi:hypothetical protein